MLGVVLLVGACRPKASAGSEVLARPESPKPTEVDATAEPEVARCTDLVDDGWDRVAVLPKVVEGPEPRHCPAANDLGLTGTVFLSLVVGCDGAVEEITVVDGIGLGCEAVAVEAVEGTRFTPAIDPDGFTARIRIPWEYVYLQVEKPVDEKP